MASIFSGVDWDMLFVPEIPILEIFLRGTIVYLILFTALRVILKRETGTLGVTDLLMIVLVSNGAQNALSSNYHSITEGIILVVTIIFWNHVLNYLGFMVPSIQKFLRPPALLLVKDGKLMKGNMKKELITEDELVTQIREQGVETIEEVKQAYMEPDGQISVISKNGGGTKRKSTV